MSRDRLRFPEPATLRSWGIFAVLDRNQCSQQGPGSLGSWMGDMVKRMQDLGINLGDTTNLLQNIMNNVVWVHESAGVPQLQAALQRVRDQAFKTFGQPCQLVLCFIRDKPSPLYRDIKIAAELDVSREMQERGQDALGLMTQVIVARRAGLGGRQVHADPSKRSQYQANLCMKVNAKLGGINTKWASRVGQLMKTYFGLQRSEQVPSLMVFGIDLTHPGKVEGGRSIAAVVGSLDTELCKYGHQVWEEPMAGSETVSSEKLVPAVKALLEQHYSCTRCKPSCLMVYRDGVSDAEMETISRLEVTSTLTACKEVQADGAYRPRVVYVVVQKRHNVRFFTGKGSQARNVSAGTVIDHTVVSPWLFDFYLNSHTAIKGTSRAARYIYLLDELGFGADGLQTFTYWLCYLYCRCARSVSIVAPVYYAHLLAFRARVTAGDSGDDVMSMASGSSSRGGTLPNMREYAKQLDGKMFFV